MADTHDGVSYDTPRRCFILRVKAIAALQFLVIVLALTGSVMTINLLQV